jgi:polysaccharide biosynthesis protein PslG
MSRPSSGIRPGRGRLLRTLAGFAVMLCSLAASATAHAAPVAALQVHPMWSQYDNAAVERQLDMARAARAGMLRVDVGWASLESDGKGRYGGWYVDKLDRVVAGAERRGMRLLLTFWETPCWASTAPDYLKQGCAGAWWDRGVQRYPPANPQDYADALEWLVRRYGDRVDAWEIWNEPNHEHYFKARDPAAAYAPLVKAAYPAAKRGNPGATVVAGSLADADYAFTERLLELGVGGSFDAWSVHPYSEDRSPFHAGIAGWAKKSMSSGVPAVRDTLLRHGQDKPLWLTEFGWSSCNIRGRAAYENCVGERRQASYLLKAFDRMRSWNYVQVGVWFNLEDTARDPSSRVDNYGLLRHNGSKKPAYRAFRAASRALATGGPVPRRPGWRKRIKLRIFKRGRVVLVRGSAPAAKRITIRGFRRGVPRLTRRPGYKRALRHKRVLRYKRVLRVKRSGRFRTRLSRHMRPGRWRFVATAHGARLVAARSSLHLRRRTAR